MPLPRELAARIRSSAYPKTNAFPPILLRGKRVLDLGCGYNALAVDGASVFGVDAFSAPRPELRDRIKFVRGNMERLPFSDASLDFISSRNALYYSHMPTTLHEVRRVLRPGGTLWGTLATWPEAATRLVASLVVLNVRDMALVSYVFLNGLLATVSGKQVRWIGRNRCESVNTCLSIRRLLRDAGFENVCAEHFDRKIIFSAVKPAKDGPPGPRGENYETAGLSGRR